MPIVRAPRPQANFYVLDKAISEDKRLSWAARGLLVFLLGKIDSWTISITNLINETAHSSRPIKRDGIYSLLNELKRAGYVRQKQTRGPGGLMGETTYFVSEVCEPVEEDEQEAEQPKPAKVKAKKVRTSPQQDQPETGPHPDKPYTDKPYTADPTLIRTDNKDSSTEGEQTEKSPFGLTVAISKRPDGLSEEVLRSYWKFRAKRKFSNSELVWNELFAELLEAGAEGYDLDKVLITAEKCSWQGFELDWIRQRLGSPASDDGVPVEQINTLYNEICHSMPESLVVDKKLRALIAERWHEHKAHQRLEFWKGLFEKANQQTAKGWRVRWLGETRLPCLEYIVTRNNFRDVTEDRVLTR